MVRTPKTVINETKEVTKSLLFHQKEYLKSKTLPKRRRHYLLLQMKEKKLSDLRKECRDIVMAGVLEHQKPRKKPKSRKR